VRKKGKTGKIKLVEERNVEDKIFILRGKKVMLDKDLALLYGVKPIRLREQVKRNIERFPKDFMFRVTNKELEYLVSHFAIPSKKYFGGYLPYVFTELGAVMLASVLNSKRAIDMSIFVVRAFIKMRKIISSYKDILKKLNEFEKKIKEHDEKIEIVFKVIKEMLIPQEVKKKKRIGF